MGLALFMHSKKRLNIADLNILYSIQPDQIDMAVMFWYLVKGDASVCHCTVAYITFYKVL